MNVFKVPYTNTLVPCEPGCIRWFFWAGTCIVCTEQGMIKHNMNDWFILGKLYVQRQIRHTYSGGEHVQQYIPMIILVAPIPLLYWNQLYYLVRATDVMLFACQLDCFYFYCLRLSINGDTAAGRVYSTSLIN